MTKGDIVEEAGLPTKEGVVAVLHSPHYISEANIVLLLHYNYLKTPLFSLFPQPPLIVIALITHYCFCSRERSDRDVKSRDW